MKVCCVCAERMRKIGEIYRYYSILLLVVLVCGLGIPDITDYLCAV